MSIARGETPLAIGPGIIDGKAEDVTPLTDEERAQLAAWAKGGST